MKQFSKLTLLFFSLLLITFANGDWNQLDPPNAPSARQGHSMVTLPDGQVVLFGGEGPQDDLFNDLFVYREDDWEELTPIGDKPAARKNAASWAGENKLYIHGGEGAEGVILEDMWIYDIYVNQWEEVEQGQVNPGSLKRHSAAVFDDGKVLVTAGMRGENTYSFKTHLYDPAANTFEVKDDIPFPTSEQSLMTNGEEAFPAQVFGENFEMAGFLVTTQGSYWVINTVDEHPGLMASAAYCDGGDNGVYAIGGEEYHDGVGYEHSKSVWKFDPGDKSWSQITDLPEFILHSAAVYDPVGDRLLVFGGKDENRDYVNSMYEYQFNPTGVGDNSELIKEFKLEQNYPNPFNPTTTIKFSIPNMETLQTNLIIYNFLGQQIATLVSEKKSPGIYEVQFNATNFSSGIYFYRLTAGSFSQTRKMTLIK